MDNLFQPNAVDTLISRIDQLQPSSQRQWGKMDVAQMMAHCSAALDMASGKVVPKRTFIGRVIGPRFRNLMTNDKPFGRGAPTAKELKIVDDRAFAKEQERLKQCVREFHQNGESKCTTHPHPFFGPLTPLEWSTGMYKHVDHHLQQFGV
jgi:Protein of unknown function (DUF1569)